jgi:exosortase D (VPLPA-CTERM-specific)
MNNDSSNMSEWAKIITVNAVVLCITIILLSLFYKNQLIKLVNVWITSEYVFIIIPLLLLSVYLVILSTQELVRTESASTWIGPLLVILGLISTWISQLSTIPVIAHYSIIITIAGLIQSLYGLKGLNKISTPLLVVIVLIPLPAFLSRNILSILQYASSEIATRVVRFSGISVFVEGNTIDLGGYHINIDKVCDYEELFPILLVTCLIILLLNIPRWQKLIIFISSILIAVMVNSSRILIASVLHEFYGSKPTNRFLLFYDSNAILMTSIVILLVLVYGMLSYNKANKKVIRCMCVTEKINNIKPILRNRHYSMPLLVVLAIIIVRITEILPLTKPEYIIPNNIIVNEFPTKIGEWVGERKKLDEIDIKNLHLSDYVLADYRRDSNIPVTLLVVYYASQESGKSSHSPRTCLPGDGWAMRNQTKEVLVNSIPDKEPLYYNRFQAIKGNNRQLVYYWYHQRGRNITNEFILKLYLFWDALTKKRTDGALVRVTTTLNLGETWQNADKRLVNFMSKLNPVILSYIPG